MINNNEPIVSIETSEIVYKKKKVGFKKTIRKAYKQRYLFFMSVPIVIWLIVFAYGPLFGWSFAFVDFTPGISVFKSQFVGLKYFKEVFTDPSFYNALNNTVIMASLSIFLCGFLIPIIFAILLNEVKGLGFKKLVQTVSYLPHFVSWVVVAGMFMQFLSPEGGLINGVLTTLHIIKEPINFLGVPKYFYAIITSATIWKELGWNAIIFISAMAGIDQELYEAAEVDGASRLRKIWHITLTGIRPTVIILLVMNIGGLVTGGFESQLLFSNGMNMNKAEVLNLYVLNYGIGLQRYSFGTAVSIVMSIASILLVIGANKISKKLSDISLF